MTKALVLSGGGSKGAFQIGVLKKWMGEQNLDYEIMVGVSVGALNIAGLGMIPYGSPKEAIDSLEKLWLDKVNTKAIYKRWFPFGRLHALWEKSIYNSSPLISLVHGAMDKEKIMKSGRRLSVGAVCLDDGEHRYSDHTDPNFVDWVLASSSYPAFLNPIELDGKLWSDGGVKSVTPLGQAIKMGADEIDVIITSNIEAVDYWQSKSKRAVPDQVIRILELMNDEIMQKDIKLTGLKNDLSDISEAYRKIKIRIVMPSSPLTMNSLEFNPDEIKAAMEQGYKDADNIKIYE